MYNFKMHLILGKMCILINALVVFSEQSSNHVITGYLTKIQFVNGFKHNFHHSY